MRPFWRLYLDALEDPMLFILLICAFVSLGVEMAAHPETGWVDGTAIFIAVNIVALVTAINDFDKEKQFRRLNDVNDNIEVRVMRGGEEKMVSHHAPAACRCGCPIPAAVAHTRRGPGADFGV